MKIAEDAGGCDVHSDVSKDGRIGIEADAGGGDGDYGESGTSGRMAWTSTSVEETPAAIVAMATAAKTAGWVWRPTPGPFRKSRGALMALVKLLPQLRPFGC